jgi:flagellar M-ring protein FliF
MPDILNQARGKAGTMLAGFTTGQKTITGLAVFALIVGAVMFSSWASRPSYGPLFTNLSPTDAASITQKLQSDKVSYQLADAGTTVMVPVNDVYSERIKLAADGLPTDGEDGYSLLDKEGITTSEFTQQVDYQRAMEGELEKTIEAINGVQAASVHLVIPQQDVFADSTEQASAAVLVSMTPGQTLDPTQVQAVVHLVASSVEGLDPDNVTVTDSNGDVLAAPGTDGTQLAAGSTDQEETEAFQDQLAKQVQDMLTQVLGPDHAVVQVTAALDFDQVTQTSQTYPNPKPVALNSSATVETYTGSGSPPSGGTLSAADAASSTTGTGTNKYSNTQTGTNYDVDQVTQQTVVAPGSIQRLSVAVALDSSDKAINQRTVQNLVSAAAGLVPARGDTLSVAMVPFDTSVATAGAKALKAATSAKSKQQLFSEIKTGAILLVLLLVVGAVLRSAKRAPQRLPLALGPELTLEPGLRTVGALGAASNAAGGFDQPTASLAGPASVAVAQRQLNTAQPTEVAGLLRDWMSDRPA